MQPGRHHRASTRKTRPSEKGQVTNQIPVNLIDWTSASEFGPVRLDLDKFDGLKKGGSRGCRDGHMYKIKKT